MHYPHLFPTPAATSLLVWSMVIHGVCDFLLQNEWMVLNKTRPGHGAACVHAGIHVLGLLLLFPLKPAMQIGLAHMLIDQRWLLLFWRRFFRQTQDPNNPVSLHVAIWGDQVAHLLVLAFACYFQGR